MITGKEKKGRRKKKNEITKPQSPTDLLLPLLMGTLGVSLFLNKPVLSQPFQSPGSSLNSSCKAMHLLSNVLHFKHLLIVDLPCLPLFKQLPPVSILPPTAALLFSCQVLLLANRKHLICKWNYAQSPHHSWKNNVLIGRNQKPQDAFVNQVLC